MGALEDLTSQLHAIANGDGDAADKTAALTAMRERINDVLGEADRLIGDQQRAREAAAMGSRRTRLVVRENADIRAGLGAEADAAALDEAGVLSHDDLDRLREEGLESEAMERLGVVFEPEHRP